MSGKRRSGLPVLNMKTRIDMNAGKKPISHSITRILLASFVFLIMSSSAALAKDEHFIITDTNNHRIIEINKKGHITWQYGTINVADDIWDHRVKGIPGMESDKTTFPMSAERTASKTTLIAEGDGQRIYEVSSDKKIVWSFSADDIDGPFYPVAARRLSSGHTVIVDWAGCRVIEVDEGKNILWEFGKSTNEDLDRKALLQPYDCQRLENGNTLIADTGNERVIEVSEHGEILWQFGETGVPWVGGTYLRHPRSARRLSNGNTLIADTGNERIIEVTADKEIVWQYGGSKGNGEHQLNEPYSAIRLKNNNTVIADRWNHRIIEVNMLGEIVFKYGDSYKAGYLPGYLNYPVSVGSTSYVLNDSEAEKVLEGLPPLNNDSKYSLVAMWPIGLWAFFCYSFVFLTYAIASRMDSRRIEDR